MDAEDWIESIIRAAMFLAGILGNNWLAFSSLPGSKSALRTNEVLFLNLAISNLITNYLVDLPDTIADFAHRWFLGEIYCGIFRFCADLSETSSIFSTFFISMFWYQKLVRSLKQGGGPVQMDNLRLVACFLLGSWSVALAFSVPHFFFVSVESNNGSHEDCIDIFPNEKVMKIYETSYLVLANAFPLAGIVYASINIVITLLQNQKRIQDHNSNAINAHDPKHNTKDPEKKYDANSTSTPGNTKENLNGSEDPKHPPSPNGYPSNQTGSCEDGGLPRPDSPNSSACAGAIKVGTANAGPNPPKAVKPSAKPSPGSNTQVRAAKSVVAVATVFLICWLTHLLLRITHSVHSSSLIVELASYVAASYTCIIPYIFLYGVKKLTCPCRR